MDRLPHSPCQFLRPLYAYSRCVAARTAPPAINQAACLRLTRRQACVAGSTRSGSSFFGLQGLRPRPTRYAHGALAVSLEALCNSHCVCYRQQSRKFARCRGCSPRPSYPCR